MRLRSLLVLGTAALLLVSGCAPEPTPKPTATSSATAAPTPTPTSDPLVEPDAAFDVTCDDVAAEMAALVGEPPTPVEPVMSVVSAMSWLQGPAQHMFQRAGGVACSAGDDARNWEVTIVPDAQAVIDGATEREGFSGEQARCDSGCVFELQDGDILLSASVRGFEIDEAGAGRLEDGLRGLAAEAAASLREVEYIDSDLVGARCDRFATRQEIGEIVQADVTVVEQFGGWGIPAEVYHVVDGARICSYGSSGDPYSAETFVVVTFLPAGAWAFERLAGDPIDIEGADAALTGTDRLGRPVLDLRIGVDWVRLTTEDAARASSLPPIAEKMVRNLTVGHTAPE